MRFFNICAKCCRFNFRVPRHPRDDVYWFWFSHDVLEEIWLRSHFIQSSSWFCNNSMGDPLKLVDEKKYGERRRSFYWQCWRHPDWHARVS